MDLKLVYVVDADNPTEGDLQLVDGDLVWMGADGTTTAEEVAQRIRTRLRMFKGEWFANEDEGVPYFDEILEKGVADGRVEAIIRAVILGTPGVASLNSYVHERDESTRSLTISFEAVTDDGFVFSSADFGPFTVGV